MVLTDAHLEHLNAMLDTMQPMDILRFCKVMFPNLYQSTAFGPSGLASLDMLSKLQAETPTAAPIELIFLDTLYHFNETLDLVEKIRERYPANKVHIFKPAGMETVEDFQRAYGEKMWETAADRYDWTAKVEPLQRAYTELKVRAVFTGRRRSQGGQRGQIPIIEVDEESGVFKINPMANWSFGQVSEYLKENKVPGNALWDMGYKSVGDWHSTQPTAPGEDERSGRWKDQKNKTECGIHNKKSRYALYMEEKAKENARLAVESESREETVLDVAPAC